MEEREIDISSIKIPEKKEEKKITSWVANTVEEVMKTEFKMEEHDHEFESLTDQEFNMQNKQVHLLSIFRNIRKKFKKIKNQ